MARQLLKDYSYSDLYIRTNLMRTFWDKNKLDPYDRDVDTVLKKSLVKLVKDVAESMVLSELADVFREPATDADYVRKCEELLSSALVANMHQAL